METVYATVDTLLITDIFIPPNGSREHSLIRIEVDPPELLKYRKIVQSQVRPSTLHDVMERARAETIAIIGCIAQTGSAITSKPKLGISRRVSSGLTRLPQQWPPL